MTEKTGRPKLVMHVCCGPCASGVLERVTGEYETSCYFYNPNIYPAAEYGLRLDQMREVARILKVRLIDDTYDADVWESEVKGLEGEPEGGRRCGVCFRRRLLMTARKAKSVGADCFGTTLTISPHKNAGLINRIGREISEEVGVRFLEADWKKQDGFKRSIEISKKLGLFRQDYCGCKYSMHG
jgi:hypothetical protein